MKGISIVERHFEKALLIVIALGVGGLVAYDFLFGASKAKVGGKEIGVSEIGPELKRAAEGLAAAQGGTDVPFTLPPVPADGQAVFAPMGREATSSDPLPQVMPAIASGLFSRTERQVPLYHEPAFGPVKMMSRVTQSDGAVKITPGKDDGLVAYLDRRPAGWAKGSTDVIWTTPAAEVDMASIRAELERAEAAANPPREKLPMHWWQQRDRSIWILDVIFDREELQKDGSWSNAVVVETLPGIATFRSESPRSAGAIAAIFAKNPEMRKRLLQPPSPPLTRGTATDPLAGEAAASETKEVRAARKRLEEAQKKLDQVTADLEAAGGEYTDPAAGAPKGKGKGKGKGGEGSDPGAGSGGSGPKSGGGGFGPGKGPGGGTDANSPEGIKKRKKLMAARDEARQEVKRLQDQVASATKPAAGAAEAPKAGDVASDRIVVWTHDFQVRPGATYRYRCRLQIANPFLGRKSELQDSQKNLDRDAGILTQPSEWAAVRIRNPHEFFALEGVQGDYASDLGRARFELFSLDKGTWCRGKELTAVGERVGRRVQQGTSVTDFTTDWFVLCVYRDLAAEAEARRSGDTSATRQMAVVLANVNDPSQIIIRRPGSDGASVERAALDKKADPAKAGPETGSGDANQGGKKG